MLVNCFRNAKLHYETLNLEPVYASKYHMELKKRAGQGVAGVMVKRGVGDNCTFACN